ncbi:hypothetical protein QQ045_014177 [Rhodiola kirilowii]
MSTTADNPITAISSTTPETYIHSSDDPLFVSHNENVGALIVTQPLVGSENYNPWRKFIERALGVKMKLGFIKRQVPRPTDVYQLARWDKCNNVVLTWISNSVSKEIAASIVHATDCATVWEELAERFSGSIDSSFVAVQQKIAECKAAKCSATRKMKNRIMKFFMGLNEDFLIVRSQALQMQPSPTLSQVYNMVVRDETQKKGKKSVVTPEISAMYASQALLGLRRAFFVSVDSDRSDQLLRPFPWLIWFRSTMCRIICAIVYAVA